MEVERKGKGMRYDRDGGRGWTQKEEFPQQAGRQKKALPKNSSRSSEPRGKHSLPERKAKDAEDEHPMTTKERRERERPPPDKEQLMKKKRREGKGRESRPPTAKKKDDQGERDRRGDNNIRRSRYIHAPSTRDHTIAYTPVVESRREVEEQEAGGKYGASPEVLCALPLERRLRHEDESPDDGHDEADPVGTRVQHLVFPIRYRERHSFFCKRGAGAEAGDGECSR